MALGQVERRLPLRRLDRLAEKIQQNDNGRTGIFNGSRYPYLIYQYNWGADPTITSGDVTGDAAPQTGIPGRITPIRLNRLPTIG